MNSDAFVLSIHGKHKDINISNVLSMFCRCSFISEIPYW